MFEQIAKWFRKKPENAQPSPAPESQQPEPAAPRKPKPTKKEPELSAKELATRNDEPYISIVRVELDPADINNGSFELDWNDKFVLNLIRAGYKIKKEDTDQNIVDRWFQTVCRNVALEIYEQDQADPTNRDDIRIIRTRDLGNGRTEVS